MPAPAEKCSGFKANGDPCTRKVKDGSRLCPWHKEPENDAFGIALLANGLSSLDLAALPVPGPMKPKGWTGPAGSPRAVVAQGDYCRGVAKETGLQCTRRTQHASGLCPYHRPSEDAFVARPVEESPYDHLLPPTLSRAARKAIIKTINKPVSSSDEPGFLYCYRVAPKGEQTPESVAESMNLIKFGRSTDVANRMRLWKASCHYVPQVLAIHPAPKSDLVQPHHHRVERLVLLELKDRFPQATLVDCLCGTDHREWLRIEPNTPGRTFEDLWKVVEKWSTFVEQHYAGKVEDLHDDDEEAKEEEVFYSVPGSPM